MFIAAEIAQGELMVKLVCGTDLSRLGIMNKDGVKNITAFLDHLEECERCREARGTLIEELNAAIGGEVEDREGSCFAVSSSTPLRKVI
jgi:hypothetical protein